MALVHIEMSEYKAMEQKAELLEEMRQTERKLHEEIKSIEQTRNDENKKLIEENKLLLKEANEKTIEAYETAKMRVVKTVINENREYKEVSRDTHDVVREFIIALNLPMRITEQILAYLRTRSMQFGEASYHTGVNFNNLARSLFRTERVVTQAAPIVTTHGFDEIREEVRQEIEEAMSSTTKRKLKQLDEINVKYSEVKDKNIELHKELEELRAKYTKILDLNEKNAKYYAELSLEISDIEKAVKEYKWWKFPTFMNAIKKIIN